MRVYTFGNGAAEGRGDMVALLGGKGAGLAEMSRIGAPVPPGFTLTTDACRAFYAEGGRELPAAARAEIARGIAHIEAQTGLELGDPNAPLLVSVRSGAAVSMPGMMDTILDVGLTRATIDGLAHRGTGLRFALDSYRRLIEMYAHIALDLEPSRLMSVRDEVLALFGRDSTAELDEAMLRGLVGAYEKALADEGVTLPAPEKQVEDAIMGVFRSWNTRRAVNYRRMQGIPDDLGTAVTVQSMVFGNLGADSGTGVAFTRNPNTGDRRLTGEYLPDAQGEDVVGGAAAVRPLTERDHGAGESLETWAPETYNELSALALRLESHFAEMQDLEFTIENGRVWMLQTRAAQRSVRAAVKIAVDMEREGLIACDEAIRRVDADSLTRLLHPSVDAHARPRVLARGLPASPGAVSGQAVFDPDEAVRRAAAGDRVILIRVETSTHDIEAIRAAHGVLTSRGGLTSHAALVARGLGTCCVTGCADLLIDERRGRFKVRNGTQVIESGMWLTLDGSTGEVILGQVATSPADPPESFGVLMAWADERRKVQVLANADDGPAAEQGKQLGADGVGLCCTEHMFLGEDRLGLVQALVLAPTAATRRAEVARILPRQRRDFTALLKAAPDRAVGIRLLDLPLHAFMPRDPAGLQDVADRLSTSVQQVISRAERLRTENPLLGHRGCRLGLTFPELYEVQVRALFEAAVDAGGHEGIEVIIPLVTSSEEMLRLRRRIAHIARQVASERGVDAIPHTVGAMIELPQSCLVAGQIAEVADFFLFGTNDLTVMTFGLNRDDAGRFLPFYVDNDVLPADPFLRMDLRTVGRLIEIAVADARARRPGFRCGLAGAHAGEARTVRWAHELGLDYVTCSPHRVPIARLAAAQAALKTGESA